ncbi:hypothetical protein Kpol_1020p38 [Vanderwaltozyma polyspora DSM 70294]|uniref:HotDog ACOT-type domain-containing protein n=1 Tax=Vanderwaltozyma polyspora (strain ATCC 22028 / DSM 70294 / BCRC 21397 / CBS 2163 / NBRC 10782 / NRRL Y-8283 / UCD 57-17) TaxID=436907 RepID=A7TLE8_VANPO|nr:uncharacterized protein Kpol_1020p38 [Vanderwaltozyma polyspora DSM 70294]EDO16929.1 hypothetical protein Kpol_1020p38 [Vanderwaltozyma polyspora DSM 70294]
MLKFHTKSIRVNSNNLFISSLLLKRCFTEGFLLNKSIPQETKDDLISRPDATATLTTDYYEYQRVAHDSVKNFKATWLNALAERKKQLKQGKIIDSYVYNHIKSHDIVEKTRNESFAHVVLPFKENPIVADFYVNAAGRIRIGQLFQDLDSLAGKIAYKHTAPVEPMIVTASVDRIYLLKPIDSIADYNVILSGSVIYTGRSSMEIAITARATKNEVPKEISEETLSDDDIFLTASFTFVARNPETHKSLEINRLLPLNEKQWLDFKRAESRIAAKKLNASNSNLEKNPPTEEESLIIHQLWSASKRLTSMPNKPSNVSFMKDTDVESTMFMQPQYRNRHSYMIFGGYLMRQTFELAYCSAASFSHSYPRFMSLDSTTFKTPVPVGSILHMNATVVYTEHVHKASNEQAKTGKDNSTVEEANCNAVTDSQPTAVNKLSFDKDSFLSKPGTLIQVKVDTTVQDLASTKKQQSGSFIYSFFAPKDAVQEGTHSSGYSTVVPETYSEMIEFIEGRRRATETALYVRQVKEN